MKAKKHQVQNKESAKRAKLNALAAALAALALFWLSAGTAAGLPPIAAEFYGTAEIDGRPAEPGTNITIHDSNDAVCGRQATTERGEFGLVPCRADDPDTLEDEGATNGETIVIKVNKMPAYNATWREGMLNKVELEANSPNVAVRLESFGLPGAILIPAIALTLTIATYIYVRKGA